MTQTFVVLTPRHTNAPPAYGMIRNGQSVTIFMHTRASAPAPDQPRSYAPVPAVGGFSLPTNIKSSRMLYGRTRERTKRFMQALCASGTYGLGRKAGAGDANQDARTNRTRWRIIIIIHSLAPPLFPSNRDTRAGALMAGDTLCYSVQNWIRHSLENRSAEEQKKTK